MPKVDSIRNAATRAIVAILMPLSSVALEAGLSIEDVYRLLRLAAVNQMTKSTKGGPANQSISGISAVTGIPRAEVSKLIKQPARFEKLNRVNEQTTNALLAAWREDARFTNNEGQPAGLPMYGRGRSFERLAKLHGRGIPTRALLEELKRTNSVTIGTDQVVNQDASVAIERGITAASLSAFGDQVSELIQTLLHNMTNVEQARLVTKITSKRIPDEQLPLVRHELVRMTEHYLSEAQELLSRNSLFGRNKKIATISVTTFCYEPPERKDADSDKKRTNYRRTVRARVEGGATLSTAKYTPTET